MSNGTLRMLCCCICLLLIPYVRSGAQEGGGDRDRHGGPGGPGGLGVPNAPREVHRSESGRERAATAPRNALQFGPIGRWWDNRNVVQAIGLRREQQKKMDSIFDANKPAILDSYKTFLKAQADLAAVNKDPQADKQRVFAAIDAVNQARSSLQKATSAMLLQIRQQMDPDQVTKLEKIR